MRMQKKRLLSVILAVTLMVISVIPMTGCGSNTKSQKKNPNLDTSETVNLKVAGSLKDYKALEIVGQKFTELYPNCTIEYEYLQDYGDTLLKRLDSEEDKIDLFSTGNITMDSERRPYALDLNAQTDKLDLSEVRGLYVNKTILAKCGLEVPTNREELLEACSVLKENGYIPFQANPGNFGQQLIYPYVASMIANADNYDEVYARVNTAEEGVEEMFRDTMDFLYTIMSEDYYDYKRGQDEYGYFMDASVDAMVHCFLNVVETDVENPVTDPDGIIPFMTAPISSRSQMEKVKEDYHSNIDYEFILAPVSEEGGFAYLSPGDGIAINKNSDHVDWALEFLNFFFQEENNKLFAEEYDVIPNTSDAIAYVSKEFGIPEDQVC